MDGEPVTPAGLQWIRSSTSVTTCCSPRTRTRPRCTCGARAATGTTERLTSEPGVHVAARAGDVTVIVSDLLDPVPRRARVLRDGEAVAEVRSLAESPMLEARPRFEVVGSRDIRIALFTPEGREPDAPLPVLADPYGGPHFSKVIKAQRALLEPQWLADQGFAVLVADGRGTPGRGVAWEHAVYRDFAGPVLDDQVDALQAAAERFDFLDLAAWVSAGGRSAATSRRWRCSGARTCSTPRSPARP